MSPQDLPMFSITSTLDGVSTGRLEPTSLVGLMGQEGIICLYLPEGRFTWGRFVRVDQVDYTCDFLPDDPTVAGLLWPGQAYPYLDGYWGERAELVLDMDRTWRESKFEPYDTTTTGGKLIPGGWDHEHCSICWEKIGRGGRETGYVSEVNDWVCGEYYRCSVVPKSLAFVAWGTRDDPTVGSNGSGVTEA